MDYPLFILVAVFGLCIGSFLNVLIYRTPREKKFWKGRSACPHCDNQLKWYHNIPLFSFLVLGGKCGFCKGPISWRYPLVEFLNALAYGVFFWYYGWTYAFGVAAFLSSALLVVFFVDLEFQIIPDLVTIPGMVVGLAVSFLPGGIGIIQAGIGLLVGGGSLYLVAMLGDWLFKKESMGGGDIKLAAMLGAFVGWQKVILIFIGSAGIGAVISIILLAVSSKMREQRLIPFGPFIAIAAMLSIIWGDQLISYYIATFLQF